MSRNLIEDVRALYQKFGHLVGGARPRHLRRAKLEERIRMAEEELRELREAVDADDLPAIADALIDKIYFDVGTMMQLGLPFQLLWDDVHRANMAKVPGEKVRGGVLNRRDMLKPPGWAGPRTAEILRACGYDPRPAGRLYADDDGEHETYGAPRPGAADPLAEVDRLRKALEEIRDHPLCAAGHGCGFQYAVAERTIGKKGAPQ